MTQGVAIPSQGVSLDIGKASGGGGTPTPTPITKKYYFGRKSAPSVFNAASTDYFNGIYLLKNSGQFNDDVSDFGSFYRAVAGDKITNISVGVGGNDAGQVTLVLYSADAPVGPWTKAFEVVVDADPGGTKAILPNPQNITLITGEYYYLAVMSADVEIVQYAMPGGSEKWTAATPPTASLNDADGSTSNYTVELFAEVTRVINP